MPKSLKYKVKSLRTQNKFIFTVKYFWKKDMLLRQNHKYKLGNNGKKKNIVLIFFVATSATWFKGDHSNGQFETKSKGSNNEF